MNRNIIINICLGLMLICTLVVGIAIPTMPLVFIPAVLLMILTDFYFIFEFYGSRNTGDK